MKAFEKPLSSEEEKYYVERYRDGDEGAKDILIERNLRLVAHIVKKYQSGNEEMEDLISIGTIGLIKAVTTFDYTKGTRLGTYAARCIDNELLMMLRAKKKMNREVSLYEPMGTDKEGNEINLLDIMEGPNEDVVDRLETDDNVKKLQRYVESCLPGREREIIKMRYGLGEYREMTQREIGEQMGISRSYVSRIEKKALKKLKEEFGYEKKH
ncbi:RNA polymerase sporulation sigma factor SigK [bacterium 1XD42-8]|nr:RNA polymerase sporulation sigma factor SigK [Lachnospiraceae bacterium]RKJ36160.1 RNA polymerase sporulation sigma factor SigK [bacterium 1XD42-8]